MSVLYKVAAVKSHFDTEQKIRYVARPCKREIIDTEKMSRLIADRSTLSTADIIATLYAFEELIPELLSNNYSVHLKPLGIFSLSFKSKVEDDPAKINARSVTDIRMQFKPDVALRDGVKYAKVKKGS